MFKYFYTKYTKSSSKNGFTLVELIVGVTVFTILIVGVYDAYTTVYKVVSTSRYKISAVDLANEQMELIRNLPYASVGIVNGIPNGVLTHIQNIIRDTATFTVITTIRNYDDPFDGLFGGTPNDTSPADSKLVDIEIDCTLCKNFKPVIIDARISPKNLETASTNGALFIKAFDANGNPIPQANVHIISVTGTSSIIIDDVTDNSGILEVVDAPPGTNAYQVSVTKSGFTTDQTYATSSTNITPTKANITVLLQQISTASFVIDRFSSAVISSTNTSCSSVTSIPFTLTGSKTIGTNPIVYKYNQSLTTGGTGTLTLSNMEWDSYALSLGTTSYELIGTNPLLPFALSPNNTQNVQLIVQPKNPNTLVVTVKDSSTGLPVSDATITLSSGGVAVATRVSSKGFLDQTDWSGGSGQATSTDLTKYFSSDGNIIVNAPTGGLTLRKSLSIYQTDGSLISSTFDTLGASNFANIVWVPMDQPTSTGASAVRFQIATNNDGGTWNFTGPDGTASTYYDLSNTNIASVNNGNRYLRYKVLLHTNDTTFTPNVADIAFTFTSSCAPPGQVSFSALPSGSYSLQISKTGYATTTLPVTISLPWQAVSVSL